MAKQLFATRYLESSLAFTYLVSFRGNDATETYLVFTNLSKSDALTGAFGGVKHSLVEKAAFEGTSEMLSLAKYRLENPKSVAGQTDDAGPSVESVWETRLVKWVAAIAAGLAIIAVIAVLIYRKRNRKVS
jgi:hypothetical protein